jgi:hypothetical protein
VLQKTKKPKSMFLLLSIEIQLTVTKIGILAEEEPTKDEKKNDFYQKNYMTP